MASTAADIIASAKAEAEAARQSALSSLSGLGTELTNAYNKQTEAANSFYTNELNNLQNTYTQDAKSAYANLMGNRQQLTNDLTRLGLTNSGYGVSQGLGLNTEYGKNLASLQSTLATNTANLGVKQGQELADLYGDYAKNKMDVDKYLYEAGQNAYDRMYSNAYQAKQDEISNALQQQYYNYLMSSSGGSSGGGGYYGGGGGEPKLTEDTYEVNTAYYQGNLNADAKTYGTFSNGYQPKGISGHGQLSQSYDKSGKKDTITFKTNTLSGQKQTVTQNVWKAADGTKWYWDGRVNKYIQI